jgi:predicted 3-demethylubiquinone-9 3-methyltransferase (glyoxalase superfamily)
LAIFGLNLTGEPHDRARYDEAGPEIHHRPAGSVMTVAFEVDGQPFAALNGHSPAGNAYRDGVE